MEVKVQEEIEGKLARTKKGHLIFLSDFKGMGSDAAIRKALSRLTKQGIVKRIAHGIYLKPVVDPLLGEIRLSLEKIAEEIARKAKVRIKPGGAYALNRLGLSPQVPLKLVYLTDGPKRLITIGKSTIRFKPTTPKKLAMKGEL